MASKSSKTTPVPSWLVMGPFGHPERRKALAWPYLPEAELAPSAKGEACGSREWRAAESDEGAVDLRALRAPMPAGSVAYAFAYVSARAACEAGIRVESEGPVAVSVNGKELLVTEGGGRSARAELAKGWNRLLVKTARTGDPPAGGERWGFSCSVSAKEELRFSTKRPRSMRPKRPRALGLMLVGGRLLADPDRTEPERPTAKLALMFYNADPREAKDSAFAVWGEQGETLAEFALESVPPFEFAEATVECDVSALARAAAKLQLAVKNLTRRRPAGWPICGEPVVRLFFLAALLDEGADAELRKAAREAYLACEAHGPDCDPLTENAQEGLRSLFSGDRDGALSALREVTSRMLEGVPDRKGELARVVGHAHIDMNWLWRYPETVQSCQDTFRQVIAFMDEFPDFTFVQSQPSTYRAIETVDPPLFERIRERVGEGRWEIAGGAFTEGDTNLSGGEAIARSFLLGQRYFLARFGKRARVGWYPDNFGHVSQLPQILRLAGCDYFYFHRCRPHLGSFRWEGTDGSRVLCYSNFTYNGRVRRDLADDFERIAPDRRRLLHVCGVGDHGGGPTREDIETAHRLNDAPRYPSVRFATAEDFFADAREEREDAADLPLHRGEMQYVFEGCYTSISRVKEGNRACESALQAAEVLSSLRRMAGERYPAENLRFAWEIVAFNQFHDILCGSAIHESNADAVADYKWALARAEFERDRSLRALADEVGVKTDGSLGQPVVVMNPQPRTRTALVEAEVFSHDLPAAARLVGWGSYYGAQNVEVVDRGQGPVATCLVRDPSGRAVPAQIVWGKVFPPGWRFRVRFLAEKLPAGGYRAYHVDPSKPGEANEPLVAAKNEKSGVIETDFLRVKFDMKTGEIAGLYDKRTKRELVARNARANRLRVYMEAPHGMSAWDIGPITREEDVTDVESVRFTERGPVRACVEAVKRWGRSKFIQRTYVYRTYPRVDFELEAHWFEQGTPTEDAPMLRAIFPLAIGRRGTACRAPTFTCHVPFDAVERPTDGQEVPAQRWVDVSDGKAGVALLNSSKYGHSFVANKSGGELRLTLLRSSYDPDIYPDQGLHRIRYALFPHAGDWKAGGVWAEGEDFSTPALATEPPSAAMGNAGASRPAEASLVSLSPASVVLSCLKESEDGDGLVARLVEVEGKETEATLTLPVELASARRLDLVELPLAGAEAPAVEGRTVRVKLRPHEIVTVGLTVST